jgi:hypothetical protein
VVGFSREARQLVGDLAGHLVRFGNQTVDPRALHGLRLMVELLEDLVESLDLLFGLVQKVHAGRTSPFGTATGDRAAQ